MNVHTIPGTAALQERPSANRPRDLKESARQTTKFKALTRRNLDSISQYGNVSEDDLFAMKVVSAVLPFRTNSYVIENLIDWDRVPDDPVYRLVFPQRGMLEAGDFGRIADLMVRDATPQEVDRAAAEIRTKLNPHPAGQREFNIPREEGETLEGLQHKYRGNDSVLPESGSDLPRLLHVLLPLGAIRGREGIEDIVQGCGQFAPLYRRPSQDLRHSVYGRRSDDHEDPGDGGLYAGPH